MVKKKVWKPRPILLSFHFKMWYPFWQCCGVHSIHSPNGHNSFHWYSPLYYSFHDLLLGVKEAKLKWTFNSVIGGVACDNIDIFIPREGHLTLTQNHRWDLIKCVGIRGPRTSWYLHWRYMIFILSQPWRVDDELHVIFLSTKACITWPIHHQCKT